jgi:hypothetical protein
MRFGISFSTIGSVEAGELQRCREDKTELPGPQAFTGDFFCAARRTNSTSLTA